MRQKKKDRTDDQQEIVDEFIEGLVETSIEELHEDNEAEGGLDEFDTELLEALEAYMSDPFEEYKTEPPDTSDNDEIDEETGTRSETCSARRSHRWENHTYQGISAICPGVFLGIKQFVR